jgi:phenylacetate-coenzyme A ligase PaaK-like adenylate-forming protein
MKRLSGFFLATFAGVMKEIDSRRIFEIRTDAEFEALALQIFQHQYHGNTVYREFCQHLGRSDRQVKKIRDIPYLPVSLFKSSRIISDGRREAVEFTSSGTTGVNPARHFVSDLSIYRNSFQKAFEYFYGPIPDYCFLALLPSYLERKGSSLVFMVNELITRSGHPYSGFYLDDYNTLAKNLKKLDDEGQRVILIGVSYALLELASKYKFQLKNSLVMETGGMKGRGPELIREELHLRLGNGFGLKRIHSEYGMTEMLSQAYSKGSGSFKTPPWLKVIVRDPDDPFNLIRQGRTGGINIIDLANIHSCSFLSTQDLGRLNEDGSFEVIGRFDHSDVRGCNLMAL